MEHEAVEGVVESLKVITYDKSYRTAQYAFEFAYLNNRKKVSTAEGTSITTTSCSSQWPSEQSHACRGNFWR